MMLEKDRLPGKYTPQADPVSVSPAAEGILTHPAVPKCVEALQKELNIEPSLSTKELFN